MKTIQIKLNVPVQFHELLAATAKLKGVSIEEFIIEELTSDLDCCLQAPMGCVAGMGEHVSHDYLEQVRELAYPGEAVHA